MEKPLIGESSSSDGGSRCKRRKDAFNRRYVAITYGSRFQKAAALVDLAEDGIGIPEQILDQPNFDRAAKFYFFFMRFDFIWTLNFFAMIVLNFLEEPLWCQNNSAFSCNSREYFYLGQLPYLTAIESFIYEGTLVACYFNWVILYPVLPFGKLQEFLFLMQGITLIILLAHTFFPITYEGSRIYWKNPLNWLKVTCLCVLVADLLAYAIYSSPVAFNFLPFRIAPYIRVVFFILSIRDLQKSIVILAGMLQTYLNILALGLLFLLFSSWLAYVIFEDTEQGTTVFTSYGMTLYQMFLLFTTSNNPDVWIPAYKASRWYCLFFILYVLLGVYFVTNLILAVVYDSFKDQLAKQVSEMDRARKRILTKAFNLIDEYNVGYLNKEQCIRLFEELNKYRTLPKISKEEFELIFDELDDTRDFKINLDEFDDLCNAIALRFQKEDVSSYFEYLPSIYHAPLSEKLKDFVRSPKFGYIISFILMVNLIAVIIETALDIQNNSAQKVWQVVEFVFGWIYVVEMALKTYSYGFENYWRDGQNRFDFLITWIIVIGETITFASPHGLTFLSNGEWIRYLLIARLLRLIRLLMHVQSYRAFVATFLTLIPSLMPYLGTIFCVMCIYCSLGIQIFGGIVNAGNPNLEGTDLFENEYSGFLLNIGIFICGSLLLDYLLFNFNDYPNGMVTLFNLLVLGNWQAWMQSYKDLTGTSWSLVYFISFYLVTVLLLLNLVIAFVLEAFFAEMELETSEKCEEEDKDGSDTKFRRRSIGKKTRSQRVDALLHHMLSSELDKTQCSNA